MRLGTKLGLCALIAALAVAVPGATALAGSGGGQPSAQAAKKGHKKHKRKRRKRRHVLTVCRHGCRFSSLQRAVNKSGKRWTIKVKPGVYHQGAIVTGHKHDGLTIRGTGKRSKVIFDGKNAHTRNGLAQNAVEGENVNNLKILNMTAKNFVANGFFIHGCNGYLMKNLVAAFNRSYGLFAKHCIGGRMTQSVGYGHGDSAYYVGETPPQKASKRKWTSLDHLDGHLNVLGFSGTNAKYVNNHDSAFYNNGAGVVPNTLDSEKFQPNADGVIQNNYIFWNNLNYFLPNSPVHTVSNGLGESFGSTLQYPTGVGIVLFGSQGWTVKNNDIFGNFEAGSYVGSDPGNALATAKNNQFLNNRNGRGGTDTNAVDFLNDGSGSGNCFSGNTSSTFENGSAPPLSDAQLYPPCPGSGAETGNNIGNAGMQLGVVGGYVTTDPPENQQCAWITHAHPAFKGYTPLVVSPGPTCTP
jgi:hypothetical protein